jgi:hypothetical protein
MPTSTSTVRRETILDAPVDAVWSAIVQPSTMLYVLRGIFGFPCLSGRVAPVAEGESGSGWAMFCHVIPFARWTITVVTVDETGHRIATSERGGVIRRWDHTLTVEAVGGGRSRYTDTVEVDAGALTGPARRIVDWIFAYRQMRLRRLTRLHLAVQPGPPGTMAGGPVIRGGRGGRVHGR